MTIPRLSLVLGVVAIVASSAQFPVAAASRSPMPVGVRSFSAGERLNYDVRFGPLHVGRGMMLLAGVDTVRGRAAWRAVFTISGGTFSAVVLHPQITTQGIFSAKGRAEVWLADDPTHIMLQLKSRLTFGSLNLCLTAYSPSYAETRNSN